MTCSTVNQMPEATINATDDSNALAEQQKVGEWLEREWRATNQRSRVIEIGENELEVTEINGEQRIRGHRCN